MTDFTKNVIKIILQIPQGNVMSYGDVAAIAGRPGAARGVAYILRGQSEKLGLPWHRVVGKGGEIRLPLEDGGQLQMEILSQEGWSFSNKRLIKQK